MSAPDLQLLFREVADLSPPEREQYFDRWQIPAELREEVESLLNFDKPPTESLPGCVARTASQFLASDAGPGEGGRCGPYRLVRLLGRGGMGSVYLAQRADGELEQQVAIKFLRNRGDQSDFLNHFLRERQILATLSHPGIARLLDVGHTDDGQPYLIMEYIDGIPIDVYALKLDLRAKLRLFLLVCDAISYAHRNLVIHRDLKPSNILVEPDGQPKLLDFGLARILDDADRGLTTERILTPDYASPEQVRGTARNTSTDVYSLAAVLYKLLTGHSPHSTADGRQESVEVLICLAEPVAPSHWKDDLPRDLDFVLGKALRKEPEERYAAVDALALDVSAVLESRPVEARSGNAWYRTRKFLRRQWLPASAVAAALLSLSLGLYATNRQQKIAQHRFDQLRQLADNLLNFDPEIRGLPGSTKARQRIATLSMAYLEGLAREAHNDKDMAFDLAQGYLQLGRVQGVPAFSNLGQSANAAESLRKADLFSEKVLAATPSRPDALMLAAHIAQDRMILADSDHHTAEALEHAHRCANRLDNLIQGGQASLVQKREAGTTMSNVAQAYMNAHQFDEAVLYARHSVEMIRATGSPAEYLCSSLSLLANALRQAGDLDAAFSSITEARNLAEHANFGNQALKVSSLYAILWRQGVILGDVDSVSLDRPDDAVEPLQKAFDLMEHQAAGDPDDIAGRARVATAARQLGAILRDRDPARALSVYDRALRRQREIKGSSKARREEARMLAQSSYPLRRLHRDREAKDRIDAAFAILQAVKDYPAERVELGGEADAALRALGDGQAGAGQREAALQTYQSLLTKVMAAQPNTETDLVRATALSGILLNLARINDQAGNHAEAAALDARRMELWRAWDRRLPHNPYVLRRLAADGLEK